MSRRTLAGAILVVWVASLGWLAFRHGRGPRPHPGRQSVPPGAAYYAVRWGDRQVGLASLTVDTLSPTDTSPALVRLTARTMLMFAGPHGPERHEEVANLFLTTGLSLRRLDVAQTGPAGKARATAEVTGDSLLAVRVDSIGAPWQAREAMDGPYVPLPALPIQLAYRDRPDIGGTYSHQVFDPSALEHFAVGATVTGDSTFIIPDSTVKDPAGRLVVAKTDTVAAWRVSGTVRGVTAHGWWDVNGFPVVMAPAGGLTFERTAFDIANDGLKALQDTLHPPTDLPALPPLAGPGDSALAAQNVAWQVVIPGADYPGLNGTGPLQSWNGDTLTMSRLHYIPMRDPLRPLQPLPVTDLRFLAALRVEPRLSPDDTALTALARRIVGDETSPRRATGLLVGWIHANIRLVSDSAAGPWPSAGQVLAQRSGGPAGVALLFTALARRVGLPARPVAGLLLDRRGSKRHTWAEAYIGDWVPVDPAFGQFPASAVHARLAVGATAQWNEYAPVAATLQPSAFLGAQ